MATKKVTMGFDEKSLERFDEFAKGMGLTRSSFVTIACHAYIDQRESVEAMKEFKEFMDEFLKTGSMDQLKNKTTDKVIE